MAFSWSCDWSHNTRDTRKQPEEASPMRCLALGAPLRLSIQLPLRDTLYILTRDAERRQFFTNTFRRVASGSPFSVSKWLEFFRWIAAYRSFRQYVTST